MTTTPSNKYSNNSIIILPYGYMLILNETSEIKKYDVKLCNTENSEYITRYSGIHQDKIEKVVSANYNIKEGVEPLIKSVFEEQDEKIEDIILEPHTTFHVLDTDMVFIKEEQDTLVFETINKNENGLGKITMSKSLFLKGYNNGIYFQIFKKEENISEPAYIGLQLAKLREDVNSGSDLQQLKKIRENIKAREYPSISKEDQEYMEKIINTCEQVEDIDLASEGENIKTSVIEFMDKLTKKDKEKWSRELRMSIDDYITEQHGEKIIDDQVEENPVLNSIMTDFFKSTFFNGLFTEEELIERFKNVNR